MRPFRNAPWFAAVAFLLALLTGAVGTLKGAAEASVLPSLPAGPSLPAEERDRLETMLESRVVAQRLADYGLTPEEAKAKVARMSPSDVSRLASLADRAPEGGSVVGVLVVAAFVALLVVVILKVSDKEIVLR